MAREYDPFAAGAFTPQCIEFELDDAQRGRRFPCDLWTPAERHGTAALPLVLYSHHSGGHRRVATFLCRHLASHGYAVAAMDHSESVAADLRGRPGESGGERARRVDAIIAARVPDLRLLLGHLLDGHAGAVPLDADRLGLVGHSFGGWAVLATPDAEPRVRAVVAHAPGGSRARRPALLPLDLDFAWDRDVPTLVLAGDADVPVTLDDVLDVYARIPGMRRLVVLHGADHQHFVDDVAAVHEAVRAMDFGAEGNWIPAAMRPIAELCSEEHAQQFVRGLTLAHLDATLRGDTSAITFMHSGVPDALRRRGIDAHEHLSS